MWRKRLIEARDSLVRWIQVILITVLLTLTYVFGVGLTAVFLLPRRLLSKAPGATESCWQPAEGYDLSTEDSARQS